MKSKELFAKLKRGEIEPTYLFSGEDFSYYLKDRIGSYWVLGARNGERTDHHTSKFNPDESVLWQGVGFWLLIATAAHPEFRMKSNSEDYELMALA